MDTQEKPKKSIFKKWWFWVLVVVVLIAIRGVSNNPSLLTSGSTASASSGNSAAPAQPTINKVGDPITIGSSVLTVNKEEVTHGGEFITPSSGNEFVNLNITIQNNSQGPQYVTTLGQMFIKDSGGNSYQVTTTDVTEQNISNDLDGQVIANSKRTGWVGFEVPAGDKGLQFVYQASEFGGNAVTVDLGQ